FWISPRTSFSYVLSLHDALPISLRLGVEVRLRLDEAEREPRLDALGQGDVVDRGREVGGDMIVRRVVDNGVGALQLEPGDGELRSEEHTSELQSRFDLVCRLLLE